MKTAHYGHKCLKYDATASLLSLRHVHPVFIQTLSSSYNVQDVKCGTVSRNSFKTRSWKFKPVLIQFHTIPIQFLIRQLRSNKFLLRPHHVPIEFKAGISITSRVITSDPTTFFAVLINA